MSARRQRHRGPRQAGFALVLVLWVLAGLTVVAVAVANSARVGGQSSRLLRDRVQAESAFISTAARLQVITATSTARANQYHGVRGRVYADGRTMEVGAGEQVSVQDARGLVNLNKADPAVLTRLLLGCGVAAAAAPAAVSALGDYVDEDELKSLNGAEAFDYRIDASLPAPRNAELLTRDELWRVKNWPELRAGWERNRCSDAVTVRGDGRFNQSTAPLPVLQAQGIDATIAQGLIDARRDGIAYDPARQGDGGPISFLRIGGGFVGSTLRVRHRVDGLEWQLEYELELTPTRPGGPWRLHEVRYIARQPESASPKVGSTFPAVDHRPSEQETEQGDAPSRLPFGN